MSDLRPRPEGVRIVRQDGSVIPCELAWGGVDSEGLAIWHIATPFNARQGDTLQVDVMPGRTGITMPTSDFDRNAS